MTLIAGDLIVAAWHGSLRKAFEAVPSLRFGMAGFCLCPAVRQICD
jgi:hypothetical protein